MIDWSEQDMRVSRTELKKAHERLQELSIPLANLSKKQLKPCQPVIILWQS